MNKVATPLLSVVIPAYNEEDRLPETLQKIDDYLQAQDYSYEILVVDDGSDDDTTQVARDFGAGKEYFKILSNDINRGKGAVVKQGVMEAVGDYILFTDADNATPISEIEKLFEYVDEYPVVAGSRHSPEGDIKITQPWHRVVLSRASNLLIRMLVAPGMYDTQCGFKLFEGETAKHIFSGVTLEGFGFDFEVMLIARKLDYPIFEQGVDWYDHPDSKVRTGRAALRTLQELFLVKYKDLKGDYDSLIRQDESE